MYEYVCYIYVWEDCQLVTSIQEYLVSSVQYTLVNTKSWLLCYIHGIRGWTVSCCGTCSSHLQFHTAYLCILEVVSKPYSTSQLPQDILLDPSCVARICLFTFFLPCVFFFILAYSGTFTVTITISTFFLKNCIFTRRLRLRSYSD